MPVHPLGLAYVALVGVLVPVLAVRGARLMAALEEPPSRAAIAQSAFVTFAVFGALSWVTSFVAGTPWADLRPLTARDALLTAGAIALLLAFAPASWLMRPAREREQLRRMLPETPAQGVLWAAMSIGAGVFEEIAWRGVLYANVSALLGSPWIAALLCAASFGVSHAYQGPRNMVLTGAIGLLLQGLVALTGSLLPAILAHALYDILVVFVLRALARRDPAAAPPG